MGCKCLFNVTHVSQPVLSGAQKGQDEKCKLNETWAWTLEQESSLCGSNVSLSPAGPFNARCRSELQTQPRETSVLKEPGGKITPQKRMDSSLHSIGLILYAGSYPDILHVHSTRVKSDVDDNSNSISGCHVRAEFDKY